MNLPTTDRVRWTTSDLELLPESSNRYEIIDGELLGASQLCSKQKYSGS